MNRAPGAPPPSGDRSVQSWFHAVAREASSQLTFSARRYEIVAALQTAG
ncbi:MAG: hypothetical protein ACR2OZ_17270 [Verrucomicrobiales bacterium]